MTNYKEILRLNKLGINNSDIAVSCGCSRTTVINTLKRITEKEISWEILSEMTNKDLSELLFPPEEKKVAYRIPDYAYIHKEMAKSGVTLTLLWLEYCEQCRENGDVPYKSTQFYKYYSDYVKKTKATMHIHRKPGEIMEVDWAGQTGGIIDTDTGEIIPAYIFVAVLPYSGYAYVEAFLSMEQESWICAHVNAYRFFGGVTRILVPDNLKTGVEKVGRKETIINKIYQDMAEHYGTAVIPARVRAPRDKATVESTVGIITTWILAALRNNQFFSLQELNLAIREKLSVFLSKPFQKRDGSREISFAEEKSYLLSLPKENFEMAQWKIMTVSYNYHISILGQNYSVPFEYIRQKVDVRITKNTVEIFFGGNRICSHPRLYGHANQYSTVESHMPPDHQKYVQWDGIRFKNWAAKIGEKTHKVVSAFLELRKVEQQNYKACMALLKLADKYSSQRLEAACERALSYTSQPSLKNIQAILKSGQDRLNDNDKPFPCTPLFEYGLTRGADYYKRRGKGC